MPGSIEVDSSRSRYYITCTTISDIIKQYSSRHYTNYANAWQLLVDRYENKKLMIHNHIKAIFEHPNSSVNFFDNVTKHLRSLKILGENTDEWDRLIIYVISNKFDPVTRRDWESHKYKDDLPKMSDLNEFLRLKCEVLEKIEVTTNEKGKS
ncbi:hypothetical protein NQ317_008049, partial [Molorchus minor]